MKLGSLDLPERTQCFSSVLVAFVFTCGFFLFVAQLIENMEDDDLDLVKEEDEEEEDDDEFVDDIYDDDEDPVL